MYQYKALIVYNSFSFTKFTNERCQRFIEEGIKLGIQIDKIGTLDLNCSFEDSKFIIPILEETKYDFVIYLDKDKYLAKAIEQYTLLVNPSESIRLCDDKMDTYIALQGINFKHPKTIPGLLNYTNIKNIKDYEKYFRHCQNKLSYPNILKASYGSLGKEVELIKNKKDLLNIFEAYIPKAHLFQEYIDNEFGTDYRVFSVGCEVIGCIKRENKNDFRSNVFQGGKGSVYQLPPEIIELVNKINMKLNLFYSGLDLVKDKNGDFLLLEVNSNAFFQEFEEITKINVAYKILEYIISYLKENKKLPA